MPKAILREMGLRDGLQSIATVVPTAAKLEWIRAAYESRIHSILAWVGTTVATLCSPSRRPISRRMAFGMQGV